MLDILKQVGFAPRACVWELTLACNLRCKHCGSFAGSKRDREMTLEENLALAVQAWLVKPYRIPSESMLDTLRPGDRVLVNRAVYHLREPHRGDVIVFHSPDDPDVVFIKRVDVPDLVGFFTGVAVMFTPIKKLANVPVFFAQASVGVQRSSASACRRAYSWLVRLHELYSDHPTEHLSMHVLPSSDKLKHPTGLLS